MYTHTHAYMHTYIYIHVYVWVVFYWFSSSGEPQLLHSLIAGFVILPLNYRKDLKWLLSNMKFQQVGFLLNSNPYRRKSRFVGRGF